MRKLILSILLFVVVAVVIIVVTSVAKYLFVQDSGKGFITVNVDEAEIIELQDCQAIELVQDGQNAIFGPVTKMVMGNDFVAIAANNRLSVFDLEGNFLTTISNNGRARSEYVQISDFWVEDNHIFVYDMNGSKVLEYSLQNSLVELHEMPKSSGGESIPFSYLVPFANGYVGKCVWNGTLGVSPALAFYDAGYNYVRTVGDLTINSGMKLGNSLFKADATEVLYWNPLGTMIYSVDDTLEVCDKYHISFGDKTYPPLSNFVDDYELLNKYESDNEWRTNHAGLIAYVWQMKNYLIFTYMYQDVPHLAVYDSTNNKTVSYRIKPLDYTIKQWCFDGEAVYILGETEEQTKLFKVYLIEN